MGVKWSLLALAICMKFFWLWLLSWSCRRSSGDSIGSLPLVLVAGSHVGGFPKIVPLIRYIILLFGGLY